MKLYVIRTKDPLDMEGSPDIAEVFSDKGIADEACELLLAAEKAKTEAQWGQRWSKFAVEYGVEEWKTEDDPKAVLARLYPDSE